MNRILKLASLLILAACGPKHKGLVKIDPLAQPYVNAFLEAGKSQGKNIVISDLIVEFGDTGAISKRAIGLCWTSPNTTPRIMLDTTFFNAKNDDWRSSLIFHELGHCILNQDHRLNDSIMYPYAHKIFAKYAYYIAELFNFNNNAMLGPTMAMKYEMTLEGCEEIEMTQEEQALQVEYQKEFEAQSQE